jgi:regulator of nucleoside diphosphate kinase
MKISVLDRNRLLGWITQIKDNWIEGKELVGPLERKLAAATVCDPHNVPDDAVTMNSTVSVRDLETRQTRVHRLVYPGEVDELAGCVSVFTPFGEQLLGARLGDVVEQPTPNGLRRLQVESIPYRPEREYAYHL